MLRGVPE